METGIALGAFLAVVLMVFAGVGAAVDQIRCTDASREAARLVARGEQARVADAVRRIAPRAATVAVTRQGPEITVRVRAGSLIDVLPGVEVGATAFAVAEPAAAEPTPPSEPPAGTGTGSSEGSRR